MKKLSKLLALAVFSLALAAPVLADIALPRPDERPTPAPTSNRSFYMHIQPDRDAKEAKLYIPRDVLRQLNAQAGGNGSPGAASTSSFSGLNGTQTIMAGLFLSMALASGGVWLVNSRKGTRGLKGAALGLAILALCGASAGLVYANAGPPAVARTLTSRILIEDAKSYGAYGDVKVELLDEGKPAITLILPMK